VRFSAPVEAFAVFDQQDSGCVSYGIELNDQRVFIKVAQTDEARESLGRAIVFHNAVRHPAIVRPIDVIDTNARRQLIYPWVDGAVLNHATTAGSDRSGLERFVTLDPGEIRAAIDAILDAHLTITAASFVSVDLYDGCFLYDFDQRHTHLIDLDEYRPGPFVLTQDRLPGSTRYMAPEEFTRGATIDERTTVFHLGRTITELLGPTGLSAVEFDVARGATHADPDQRFPDVEQMTSAWHHSRV
jgi:serine/threonine-protein kinase